MRAPTIRLPNGRIMKASNPKHRAFTILLIAALTFIISTPMFLVHPVAAQADQSSEFYQKCFAWDYDGKHWTWNLSIPTALYEAYKEVPVSTRTHNGPGGYGYMTTTQDYYVRSLADKLNQTATDMHYGSYDKVSFALAFVQSLPYTSDNVTEGYNEYPRFPIETLVDDGGDCEDTSILFATITLIMGYGTVYINPPDHYAVGILGNGLHGTSWEYPQGSNKTYYYCETTGDGFKIGQLPQEFAGQSAYIYPIDQTSQFIPAVAVTPSDQPTDSPVTGNATPLPTGAPDGASPTVTNPDVQQVRPLATVIADNPALFAVIITAIVVSFAFTLWSVRRRHPADETSHIGTSEAVSGVGSQVEKFCVHCGENNRDYAVFCEKCGRQIG
jgi:hypothetical protein